MSNVFGSCLDKHTTWEVVDGQVTFSSNVEGQDPVTLCLNPVKGATLNGEPVAIEEGILILEDMFGSGIVSADGSTYTITLPGEDPVDICLNPVKSVTGAGVDNTDPQNPVINGLSTTVAAPEGFHTITTDDGVATQVCLAPIKSINGVTPNINGNVNVADLFSTTVDNGDGTFTTTNADGATVTWSGDTFASQMDNGDGTVTFTMADGSTVTLCLNPVKGIRDDGEGTYTVVYANGTEGAIIEASSAGVVTPDNAAVATNPDGDYIVSQCCVEPQTVDDDGNIIDPVTGDAVPSGLPSGTEVMVTTDVNGANPVATKIPENPVDSIDCDQGDRVVTYCDGSSKRFYSDFGHQTQPFNPALAARPLGSETPLGPVAGTERFTDITLPPCGRCVRFTYHHTYALQNVSQQVGTNGRIFLQPEYNIDGGPWVPYITGRFDALLEHRGDGDGAETEESFTDETKVDIEGGTHTIGTRLNIPSQNNMATESLWNIGPANLYLDWIEEKCKDLVVTPLKKKTMRSPLTRTK